MATTIPLHTGLTETIEAFEDNYRDGYAYAVWDTYPNIIFQYPESDIDAGKELFEKNMTNFQRSGTTALFVIKFYPLPKDGEFIGSGKGNKCLASIPVRLNDFKIIEVDGKPVYEPGRGNGNEYRMFEAIETIKGLPEKINAQLEAKFAAYEARLQELEDLEPEPETGGALGQIGKLLENPQISAVVPGLIGAVTELIKNFLPKQPIQQPVVMANAINGTADTPVQDQTVLPNGEAISEELLNASLIRLSKFMIIDKDLALLADFAETQKSTFDMMLCTLRAQRNEKS